MAIAAAPQHKMDRREIMNLTPKIAAAPRHPCETVKKAGVS